MSEPRPLRLLFVEDNPQDRALAMRELQRAFGEIDLHLARNEPELQQVLAEGGLDVVITDYQLLWTDGIRVLRAVKERFPHCPVVMFTGTGSQEVAVEAMKSGLDDYVLKSPQHYVRLPVAVRAALHREEQKRAIAEAEAARDRLQGELQARLAELAERDRRKDEFLAVLGHELRNPLCAISNAVHLLHERGGGDERDARLRTTALRQVRHLTRLVDDLLDVARVTRGRIELRVTRLELGELVAAVVEANRPAAEALRLELVYSPYDGPLLIQGDPTRLQQVFANLLDNAMKYTPAGGRVSVRLESASGQAVVRVSDTGCGIPAGAHSRLFELFTPVGRSTTQTEGGLGIGLFLAQSLVRLHRGTVEARSDGAGQGSEFIVRLPLETPQ